MKKEDVKDVLEELETMISARIRELDNVNGMQAHRHAFIYYRSKIFAALLLLDKR
jgi:hypothetical protein